MTLFSKRNEFLPHSITGIIASTLNIPLTGQIQCQQLRLSFHIKLRSCSSKQLLCWDFLLQYYRLGMHPPVFCRVCDEVKCVLEGPEVFQIYSLSKTPWIINNTWRKCFHVHALSLSSSQCPLFCLACTFSLPRNAINITKCSPWHQQGVCRRNSLGMGNGETNQTRAGM